MHSSRLSFVALVAILSGACNSDTPPTRPLIIDVHLHALPANAFDGVGPRPLAVCVGGFWPDFARRFPGLGECRDSLIPPTTDDSLLQGTIAAMEQFNVIGVASGPLPVVRQWRRSAPRRIIPALLVDGSESLDSVPQWVADSTVSVLGELLFQYAGLRPSDSLPEAWFAMAERLDAPIGVHVGPGAAGAAYAQAPTYRMALSDPLLLESTLIRHPRLRLYVMHAGWPMLDGMMGLLYAHPQVYIDVSVINWMLPRAEFHTYLRRLVEAGFTKRIMYGSDQMIWPASIARGIEAINTAPFLTEQDKRDIFCNNAARFLRLDQPGSTFPRC